MKVNKTIKHLLLTTVTVAMTACGGGDSSSGIYKPKDSDGDGFYDAVDPAPDDASNPGDFSSPKAIINNPKIKEALKKAKEHGVTIRTELGTNPPKLTGYYISETSGGIIVATQTGLDIGGHWLGGEYRIRTKGKYYQDNHISFDDYEALGYGSSVGSILAGDGKHFTLYSPTSIGCLQSDGGNYSVPTIKIVSGTRDAKSGDIINRRSLNVKVGTATGTYTTACYDRLPGNPTNKWTVARRAALRKVDVDEFSYMCVDDNKAYVPNERWRNRDNESCICTTDYDVECK